MSEVSFLERYSYQAWWSPLVREWLSVISFQKCSRYPAFPLFLWHMPRSYGWKGSWWLLLNNALWWAPNASLHIITREMLYVLATPPPVSVGWRGSPWPCTLAASTGHRKEQHWPLCFCSSLDVILLGLSSALPSLVLTLFGIPF